MFEKIRREHILKAIKKVDIEGIPRNAQSTTYDVFYKDKRYPPKLLISWAGFFLEGNEIDRSSFPGGNGTDCFKKLEEEGFQIVEKRLGTQEDIYSILLDFLKQSGNDDLKTAHYPKRYGDLKLKVSFGQGVQAKIPWIALLGEGQTTSNGIYPVFLFYKNLNRLVLAKGISETVEPENSWKVSSNERSIQEYFFEENLGPPHRYGASIVYAVYELNSELDETKVRKDISSLLTEYNGISFTSKPSNVNLNADRDTLSDFTSIVKPFILLAGISGTGKTRFVRKQASPHNVGRNNYCLVPVRPDWHEPSDLLGYVSRIGNKPKYVSTKVLQFIIDAWKAIAPNASQAGTGELNFESPPYWLCLDEMNLAPVEQYFADYISVLESRKFSDGAYSCEPLLDKSILITDEYDIQADLKLSDDNDLWDYFCEFGIGIPPNLIVAGTVNMDETTHGFSRKVIDRALTIDFGEFYPNEYDKFFKGQAEPKVLTYGIETRAKLETINCIADSDGTSSIGFLNAVNDVLEGTPFQLAYRALNELLLFVNSFSPDSQEKLQAVWDDFLMTKVLPRIDGDEDKLRITRNGEPTNLLKELEVTLEIKLDLIWGDDKKRLDLFRVDAQNNEIKNISCRSRKKIKWMNDRLEANTFTSYWP